MPNRFGNERYRGAESSSSNAIQDSALALSFDGKRFSARATTQEETGRSLWLLAGILLVARRAPESQLLAGLQAKVLHLDVIEYVLDRFEVELKRALESRNGEAAAWRGQEAAIERKIGNLPRALADGYSAAIRAELAKLETQLAAVRHTAAASHSSVLADRMRNTRKFVKS
jgi:hypothetical protein